VILDRGNDLYCPARQKGVSLLQIDASTLRLPGQSMRIALRLRLTH
jgi:hypothetical protein